MRFMEDRIREIQLKVDAERKQLSALESTLTDPATKEYLLKRAWHHLDDVEMILDWARKASNASNEAMLLTGANLFLTLAVKQREGVQEIIAKYGPNAVMAGG